MVPVLYFYVVCVCVSVCLSACLTACVSLVPSLLFACLFSKSPRKKVKSGGREDEHDLEGAAGGETMIRIYCIKLLLLLLLLLLIGFETVSLCSNHGCLRTHSGDQGALEFTEIHLPLPLKCWA